MKRWQLQTAKARLSEVVKAAQADGPQEITVRGDSAAVLMSRRDFDRLRRGKPSFLDFLRRSPLAGIELKVERDRSAARDVSL